MPLPIAQDMSAKLTDFGTATSGPDSGATHRSTRILGTLGYLDPTYHQTGVFRYDCLCFLFRELWITEDCLVFVS